MVHTRLSQSLDKQNQHFSGTYLTQSFPEQTRVKEFICSSNLIEIIKCEAKHFLEYAQSTKLQEESFNAIIINLPFVYTDFLIHYMDLLHFVIEEPVQFISAVKYSVFSLLRDILKGLTLESAKKNLLHIDIDQVHVLIRLADLPLQQDLCFQPHLNLYRTCITEVTGIICAVSDPEKVVLQSVWYCSKGCKRNKIKKKSFNGIL